MNKKTLDALECLIGLAKFGSISVAAKELKLEHKTVKNKILALEKDVNKKLINSSSLGTSLTDEGWLLYQSVSNDYNNLMQKYRAYLGDEEGIKRDNLINLLLPPATTIFFSVNVLPKLYKKHPELTVRTTTLNINYVLSYGSHIKNIINTFNIIGVQESALKLINQDEWHLAASFNERLKLFAHKDYIISHGIKNFDDIKNTNFIIRQSSNEERGVLNFFNKKLDYEENIKIRRATMAENDLVKYHLINQKVGVGLVSDVVLNCDQNVDLVELFPDYQYRDSGSYAFIYRHNEIDYKYIESIINLTKQAYDQKLK